MYSYQEVKKNIFTEEGQILFLKIRDTTKSLLKLAGAARLQEMAMHNSGSTWDMLACVDRLVELGEIREITPKGCVAQARVFVAMNE